jgi:hypothetical protein
MALASVMKNSSTRLMNQPNLKEAYVKTSSHEKDQENKRFQENCKMRRKPYIKWLFSRDLYNYNVVKILDNTEDLHPQSFQARLQQRVSALRPLPSPGTDALASYRIN